MSILRAVTLAAGIVGGGVALARNRLDKEIEKKIDARIIEARDDAIAELDSTIASLIRRQVLVFGRNLLIKAALAGTVVAGRLAGLYDREIMGWALLALVGGFMIYDFANMWPNLKLGFQHARKANWNPARALRSYVAADVFDRAYEHVMEETQDKKVKYWIALSRYQPEQISEKIASALSQVAAAASVDIVRTRAVVGGSQIAAMMAIYSITLTWAVIAVR